MRSPRFRVTVQRVLMLVALVGLVIGAESLRRRSEICRGLAARHASEGARLAVTREGRLREAQGDPDPSRRAVASFDADRHRAAIAWHEDREHEARAAAWRPWAALPTEGRQAPWPPIPPELLQKPASPPGATRQRRSLVDTFLFHPARFPLGDWTQRDPTIEDAWFRARDGVLLNGWFAPSQRPRAVVLYCEGNAGNLTGRCWVLDLFRDRMGASVLIFDYRGYGRSEAVPSQEGILDDARAARRWLARRTGVAEEEIVLVGHSLGGAVAVDLAARDGARGLVLENTFSSLAELTGWHFGRVARMLVSDRLNSAGKIAGYAGPLLQTHGDADTVVPFLLGKRLFDAANEPKRFVEVAGGDHNDPPTPEYLDSLERFFDDLPASSSRRAKTTGDGPRR